MSNHELYNVRLHILSPVHVGSGQELDPFSYVIRNNKLLIIDLAKWIENYSDKETLYQKMDSDDYIDLRNYIAENFNDENAVLSTIDVKSSEVVRTYKKAVYDKTSRNQALINFMTRNEITKTPYLPGSSIKGAIRTAIANRFVISANIKSGDSYKSKYNEKIFGKSTNDPMKNLKISDVSLDNFSTVIYEAREHSSKDSRTPKGSYEAAVSFCHTDTPVVYPLNITLKPFDLHGETVDIRFLIDSLHRFYMPKFIEEYEKFYKDESYKDIQRAIAPLNMEALRLKTNEAFIRIGHFSHVECVTLDKVRSPKTRKGRDGKPLPWGQTRTLANGIYPFGWTKIEFLNLESKSRDKEKWPFSVEEIKNFIKKQEKTNKEKDKPAAIKNTLEKEGVGAKTEQQSKTKTPLEKMLDRLNMLKNTEAGRIKGEIVNNMEKELKTVEERVKIAKAIKDKLDKNAFKRIDKKANGYLSGLIAKD